MPCGHPVRYPHAAGQRLGPDTFRNEEISRRWHLQERRNRRRRFQNLQLPARVKHDARLEPFERCQAKVARWVIRATGANELPRRLVAIHDTCRERNEQPHEKDRAGRRSQERSGAIGAAKRAAPVPGRWQEERAPPPPRRRGRGNARPQARDPRLSPRRRSASALAPTPMTQLGTLSVPSRQPTRRRAVRIASAG